MLDLCISIGILLVSKQIIPHQNISNKIILGELSLAGHVKNIKGTIPILINSFKNGYKKFILPKDNFSESNFIKDVNIDYFENLNKVVNYIKGGEVNSKLELVDESSEKEIKFINFEDVLGYISSK